MPGRADAVVPMTRPPTGALRDYGVTWPSVRHPPRGPRPLSTTRRALTRSVPPSHWVLRGPGRHRVGHRGASGNLGHLDPAPRYLVVGKTHPNCLHNSGESYRHLFGAATPRLSEQVEFQRRLLSSTCSNHRAHADVVPSSHDLSRPGDLGRADRGGWRPASR